MKRLACLVVLLEVALVAGAGAQSLADVARKEEQRRKHIKNPAEVITNRDLHAPEVVGPPADQSGAPPDGSVQPAQSPEGGQSAAPDGEQSAESSAPSSSMPPPPGDDEASRARSQQEWAKTMADARAELERTKMFAEALQTRANSLLTDFTNRDDPAQRAAIDVERRRTLAELERAKADIVKQTQALADLETAARRQGVPPGWVR
jgi:hypothetical protein